jgi:hypothetical protein
VNPIAIFTYIKDGVILVVLAVLVFAVYRAGEDRVKSSDLTGLRNELKTQATQLTNWRKESSDATAKLSSDVAQINAAPPVVHTWVREQSCPKPSVLSPPPSEAAGNSPAAGGVQPGLGELSEGSRLDQIVAEFKRKYETKFAEWRAEDSQWPK